jgi:Domain of unknown function (DUF5666)
MKRRAFVIVGMAFALLAVQGFAAPQQAPNPQGRAQGMARGERAMGVINSVGVNQFQLKKADGSLLTVMVGDNTRYREDRRQIQLEDLKPGDHVLILGETNTNKEFEARMVRRLTENDMARFGRNMGDRAFGQIVSIENNEIKVNNRFRGEQTVVVNDQTQFMKDGRAITLKDLKVGDRIFATGKEENGKLDADRVMTGQFRRFRGQGPGNGPPPPPPQQ